MRTKLKLISILMALSAMFTGTLVYGQDPAQYGTPYAGVPDRMDANIYQLNIREYTTSRTFAAATANIQRIKDLGINVIYLMPFYPVSSDPRGSDLSPYCIKDLKGVSSDLGDLNAVRAFVDAAHSKGMAVIFDFVVNQTAWDHPWITQHPDWYKKDANGNIASPNAGTDAAPFYFTDVAAVDLNVSAAAAAMVDAMRYWIFAANIDGFRFDWADEAPQAFWTNTINNLRGITTHKLLLLAEGSNEGSTSGCATCGDNQPGTHYAQGFDYIFGTNFYWNVMKKIWNSGEPVTNLDGVTNGEYNGASSTQLVARFLSNHDDYNADGSPFSFLSGGRNAVMSAFIVATYHRSVPFIYNGIEVGNTNALPYPWRNGDINWTQDLTVYTEMQKILNFRNSSMAIKRGQPTSYTTSSNNNVIAFTKINGTEKVAVMVNVRNSTQTFTIPSGMAGTYNDAYNPGGASVTLSTGTVVSLTPYQYLVYTNANVPVVAVTGVSVSPVSVSVKAGLTTQLSATVSPSNATNQSVTWSSSNTSVATVNSAGLVTAVATGTANITVTTVDGNKTATCAVTVTPATIFTVYFYKPAAWATTMKIYTWSSLPAGVLADGVWPGVAMTAGSGSTAGWYSYTFTNVTSTNLIFNDGTTKTADLSRAGTTGWFMPTDGSNGTNGIWTDTQPAVVAVTGVTMSPTSASVLIGATTQLTATVAPTNANNKTVTWTSSNSAIASVSSTGLVTGVAAGSATITVTTQDGNKTATSTITVTTPPQTAYAGTIAIPGTVEVENFDNGGETVAYHDNETANNGGQYRTNYGVDIEVCSEGGYNVGWTNNDEWLEYTVNVASTGTYNFDIRAASGGSGGTFHIEFGGVDKTGTLTFPGTGGWQNWQSVTKTGVSLTAGTQIMRIYLITGGYNLNKVTITSTATIPVTGVTLSPTTASLTVGGTLQLTPTVAPSNATNQAVSYSSNNTAVATINSSGLVTAVATGSAIVTVTTQDGNKTATCGVTVTTASGTYYAIQNRWKNTYLYDAGASVGYGTTVANNNYKWQKVAVDGTYFYLKNLGTGEYMHIENQTGSVQCTTDPNILTWWSSQWSQDYIDGTWVRFRNRWQTGSIIHVENQTGSAQYSGAQDSWYSAQWQLVVVSARATDVAEANSMSGVEIYPNPVTNGNVNVKLNYEVNNVQVVLTDMTGRVVINMLKESNDFSLNTSTLKPGLYFLKIQNGTNKYFEKLVVK